MIAMIDTSGTLHIDSSPWKMLGLFAAAILMTALSGAIALRLLPGVAPGSLHEFIGYIGLLFFGLCAGLLIWRSIRQRSPVVTITPEGIRDTRIAAEFIPWRAVRNISTWSYQRQKIMVLAIDPAVERQLTLTSIARWTRSANRGLGADGLCLSAQGLKISYNALFETSTAYAQAALRQQGP
jgi:hypothetical protein